MRLSKTIFAVLAVVFGSLAFLFSILDVDDKLAAMFPALDGLLHYLKFVIVVVLALLIFVGLVWISVLIWELWQTRKSKLSGLGAEPCIESELDRIHEIACDHLTEVPDLNDTRKLFLHNKKSILKIVDCRRGNEIVGYVVVLPLTKNGVQRVQSKTLSVLHDGLSIFGKRMPNNQDYYLGAAVAPNRLARAKAVKVVKDFCATKKVRSIYSRPTTSLGLQALLNNDFKTVHDEDKAETGVYFVRHMR